LIKAACQSKKAKKKGQDFSAHDETNRQSIRACKQHTEVSLSAKSKGKTPVQFDQQATDHYRTKAGFYPEERSYSSAS